MSLVRRSLSSLLWTLLCLLPLGQALAAPPPAPAPADPSKIYRIGFLEGGDYGSQRASLAAFKHALARRGWAKRVAFPEDAHISPGWDKDASVYQEQARKLFNRPDLDLIIGMGEEGSRALLAVNNGKTPIIGMDIDDSVGAGILTPDYQSPAENFTTYTIPHRWLSIVALFHQVMRFKRLGIMYHDTPDGRTYSNAQDVREVARDRGFSVVEYPGLDHAESMATCVVGLKDLVARGIDAYYIGSTNCFDWTTHDPTPLLQYLEENHVVTFAREGSGLVHLGALLGTSSVQFDTLAEVHVDQMMAILAGKKPKDLVKVLDVDLRLSLNFQTAKELGVDFPLDLLISSDEIVTKTATHADLLKGDQEIH